MTRDQANALLDLVRQGYMMASPWQITQALIVTGDIGRAAS